MRAPRSVSTIFLVLILLITTPLLSGCLTRSTTVGDRLSGSIVVATSPDNARGVPTIDVPQSMTSVIGVTDYESTPDTDEKPADESTDVSASEEVPASSGAPAQDATDPDEAAAQKPDPAKQRALVGTRATFSGLTAGQVDQLGDIVATAFDDSSMAMDMKINRSDDVVRFRGNADLTDLDPERDYLSLTVTFGGPVTATNGRQTGENSVTWLLEPGKPTDLSADSTYDDPATAAVSSWSWFFGIICLLVVALVARLAYTGRHRGPRPGRPE